MLEADGISAEVINIHTIKPLDEELGTFFCKENRKSRNGRRTFRDRWTWKCSCGCAVQRKRRQE